MKHEHSPLCHCCPNAAPSSSANFELSRRTFLGSMVAGGALLSNVAWSSLASGGDADPDGPDGFFPPPPPRRTLIVLPVLIYDHHHRMEQVSWRGWGGVQTPEAAAKEAEQITKELGELKENADFPVEFFPIQICGHIGEAQNNENLAKADVVLIYGSVGGIEGSHNLGKDVVVFQRWRSGPVYLQYEIVSPRFLRQHQDTLQLQNIQFDDVVTDSLDELEWRLRALCGLKNARNSRILCIGGPDAWSQNAERQKILFDAIHKSWNMDIQTIPYEKLDELLEEARADEKLAAWAQKAADAYLQLPNTKLSTEKEFVVNCFVLTSVFCKLMKQAECKAITVFGCMGTIIPKARTTACLTLSLLNDAGYLAFCESDFAVVPSGMALAAITGKPVFMNDPTYAHDHIMTLAHCTAPRKMDGENLSPVEIVTHFESDYGAAPKVEFALGQEVTCILPDFLGVRWAGLKAKVVDVPFRPICRSQLDVEYAVTDELVNEKMPGFHWMMGYGDYTKELGYMLRRVGIQWDNLDKYPKY
ncbi:MAG: hypothetical protein J6X44_11595 [Thermoguttaceae bacterium]|nr:hypothetical protein [Thermoguttaceae bacterium]